MMEARKADLKKDLIESLEDDKFFLEMELSRYAQDPNMNYKKKIDDMKIMVKDIHQLTASIELVKNIFKAPEPQQNIQNLKQPQTQNLQSHTE